MSKPSQSNLAAEEEEAQTPHIPHLIIPPSSIAGNSGQHTSPANSDQEIAVSEEGEEEEAPPALGAGELPVQQVQDQDQDQPQQDQGAVVEAVQEAEQAGEEPPQEDGIDQQQGVVIQDRPVIMANQEAAQSKMIVTVLTGKNHGKICKIVLLSSVIDTTKNPLNLLKDNIFNKQNAIVTNRDGIPTRIYYMNKLLDDLVSESPPELRDYAKVLLQSVLGEKEFSTNVWNIVIDKIKEENPVNSLIDVYIMDYEDVLIRSLTKELVKVCSEVKSQIASVE
mmetsp:Transcript_23401/g.58729  ORF Transcript_23401/g.58729 Transcript_23401/m.58729 type:complete len:280 (+) Transcript_23401:2670-3509(+)